MSSLQGEKPQLTKYACATSEQKEGNFNAHLCRIFGQLADFYEVLFLHAYTLSSFSFSMQGARSTKFK